MKTTTHPGIRAAIYILATLGAAAICAALDAGILAAVARVLNGGVSAGIFAAIVATDLAHAAYAARQIACRQSSNVLRARHASIGSRI